MTAGDRAERDLANDETNGMSHDRPNKRPRLSLENDEAIHQLTGTSVEQANAELSRASSVVEPVNYEDLDMDLQPSSQPSERDGALLFGSQEVTLSATMRTPASTPYHSTSGPPITALEQPQGSDLQELPSATAPEPHQLPSSVETVAPGPDDDAEYDDPWFDAACLTTTDEGGQILPDHLPVPPSSTPGKKQDLERRRSSEIRRSQEAVRAKELVKDGTSTRLTSMVEEEEIPKAKTGSLFSFGNGAAVPPVSAKSREKATKLFAEDPAETFGFRDIAAPKRDDDDYFSIGLDQPAGMLDEFDMNSDASAVPVFAGFQTGKGKKLAGPSEASKARAAKIFGEDLADLPPIEKLFEVASSVPTVLDEATSHTAAFDSASINLGFGKPDASALPVTVFETPTKQIEKPSSEQPGPSNIPMSSLFQTAAGGNVPAVSAKSQAKALAMFAEAGEEDEAAMTSMPKPGRVTVPNPVAIPTLHPTKPTLIQTTQEAHRALDALSRLTSDPVLADAAHKMASTNPDPPQTPVRQMPQAPPRKDHTPYIKDVTNQPIMRTPVQAEKAVRPTMTPLLKREHSARPLASPLASPRLGIGLGMTPRSRSTLNKRPVFKTPFKPEGGSVSTPSNHRAVSGVRTPGQSTVVRTKAIPVDTRPVFDLNCPLPRETMSQAGLQPQHHSAQSIVELGCPEEIVKITASNALFYHFATPGTAMKGPEDAYQQILKDGCSQITQVWVNNHWSLILWKLAGIVKAKPALWEARWTFAEVVRQLKYRYEREVNLAQRPAIKRLQEQDSPASLPMVLCIASITRGEQKTSEGSSTSSSSLELTDGWYRIRANVDPPLQRAIDTGKLRTGYKMAIAGARLDATKEGTDVLEALNKSTLRISGNSSSLARWDCRLGFSLRPFIATMTSLTKDGGTIPLMAVKIHRIYPLAFMSKEKGKGTAPWSEAEEFTLQEEWTQRYNQERERLQEACDKRMHTLEDDLDRLKQSCDGLEVDRNAVDDADLQDSVLEAYHQTAQKGAFLRTLNPAQLLALAQKAQEEFATESCNGRAETESTLQSIMPLRATRSFQVVRMEDAATNTQGRQRTAQLQVWDARQLGKGILQEGAHYLVSSLAPAQPASWCGPSESGEIFLCTNRNTTWKRLE